MKKLLIGLSALMMLAGVYIVQQARAGITCSLPFQLQNNTTADATQVMANYNALVTCFTSAAAAGVNNDITALTALATPITPAQGGSRNYYGTGAGTANVQTVGSVVPTGFSIAAGLTITYIPSVTNTASATLNVNAGGAVTVNRMTTAGPAILVGGELQANNPAQLVYNGTVWILQGRFDIPGQYMDWAPGVTIPLGYLTADGSCVSRTTYATLFTIMGTGYGACDGVTTFGLPDARGRTFAGVDGGSGRITLCGSSGVIGSVCGAQQVTLAHTNLPSGVNMGPGTLAGALNSSTVGGSVRFSANTGNTPGGAANTVMVGASGGSGSTADSLSVSLSVTDQAVNISGTVPLGGSSTPVLLLTPTIVSQKLIKM